MGTRLRALKKAEKLGGVGKLTEKLIKELTIYYGLAIRRNPTRAADMKKAIWATYNHKISTDALPQHEDCSPTWCVYAAAAADGEDLDADWMAHDPPLNAEVAEKIKPIYEALSNDELLKRCEGGYTQNANESLNALIWKFAPKHLHSGEKTVKIASHIAGILFNEGYNGILWLMNDLGIRIGRQCYEFAEKSNKRREAQKERRRIQATKEARKARKAQKELEAIDEDDMPTADELLYGPGIAD